MIFKICFISLLCLISLNNCDITVTDPTSLQSALTNAKPGDTIRLADGLYSQSGVFKITKSGTSTNPITLIGSRKAILSSQNNTDAIYLNGVSWWILDGFTISSNRQGMLLESVTNSILQNLNINVCIDSAIRIRQNSTDNLIQNCTITETGLSSNPGNGEGIYIGDKQVNVATKGYDFTKNLRIRYNYFGPNVRGESIDIKESANNIIVEMNYFNGAGMVPLKENGSQSQAWVAVKGSNCTIQNNYGVGSVLDGFIVMTEDFATDSTSSKVQQHETTTYLNTGCSNTFKNNVCKGLPSDGTCVNTYRLLTKLNSQACSTNPNVVINNTVS